MSPRPHLCRVLGLVALVFAGEARADPFNLLLHPPGNMVGQASVDALQRDGRAAQCRMQDGDFCQVLVYPVRPGHNNVRYYDFDWRYYDYLDDRGVGGVRFYYYQREYNVARVAAAVVRDQYEYLSAKFHFRPTQRVPYILYNSHHEFENTNVFFVNEYILGVTSPLDLRMALPFWGELSRFREVSRHEMTHQFQIQKMAERAAAAGVETAISKMPEWFIEGLAEYYSKDGIDLETDMFARDLLLNPRPEKLYVVPDFWDDSIESYVFTYKMGQIRIAFLADTYGEKILQAILDESPLMQQDSGLFLALFDSAHTPFKDLLARLTGDKPEAISQRFSAWLKRRYMPQYLRSRQEPPEFPSVDLKGEPDAFTSLGSDILFYRAVERDSGRAHLYLADRHDKESVTEVAVDQVPGVETLYPVLRRVMAISPGMVAFTARNGQSDTLYVVPYKRLKNSQHIKFRLGPRREIRLDQSGLIEAGDPAFSPTGDRIAFFGLEDNGQVNIWIANVKTGALQRLTDDLYAERDLEWSPEPPSVYGLAGDSHDGTILFTSDMTEHHKFNLMAMDPVTGNTRRLADEPSDERAPRALGNGRVVFASDAQGKLDLHIYDAKTQTITRITDFVTGLTSPSPGPRGLSAVGFYGGQYRIFDVPQDTQLSADVRPALVHAEPPEGFPMEMIPPNSPEYAPLKAGNWRVTNGAAGIGTSGFGGAEVLFGDVLNDRNILLQVGFYGAWDLTNGLALYLDRSRRDEWGFGLYNTFTERRDTSPPAFSNSVFYLEREFGGQALWARALSAFTRTEAHVALEGVDRSFLFPVDQSGFAEDVVSVPALQQWNAARAGYDMEAQASANIGYDTTRYAWPVGAVGGGSLYLEGGGGYLPLKEQGYGYVQFDGQVHWRPWSWLIIHFRGAGGITGGSPFGKQFWLSSYDNLRAFYPTDLRLIGTTFLTTNLNVEVPLNWLIKVLFMDDIKFIVGVDFGGISPTVDQLWADRVFDVALGVNLGLGPFEVRLQFAYPVNLGNNYVNNGWVPNISLSYAYF